MTHNPVPLPLEPRFGAFGERTERFDPPHDFQADIDAISRIDAVPIILDVVCRTTGMGFAAVARVTDDRWIACAVLDTNETGLQRGSELKVETTICHEIRTSREPVVIDHVAQDTAYCGHHTPAMYGFQSYISMPIILSDGRFFGTLCAVDPRPARIGNRETISMFRLFAELIASHLETGERLLISQTELMKEREISELREQFIAVLGHDLRNPVAAFDSGLQILLRTPQNEKGRQAIAMMQGSVTRMRGLIDNVLDFARVRLGDGLVLRVGDEQSLQSVLGQVISELRSIRPDRTIEADILIDAPVRVDHERIAQLCSNLLGNALTHGATDGPVRVSASTQNDTFELSIANKGTPIPAACLEKLFRPYFRGDQSDQKGLGLGLYIASEIAQAHGGTLAATSDATETRFTFRMPVI